MRNIKRLFVLSLVALLVGCKEDNDGWTKIRARVVPDVVKEGLLSSFLKYDQEILYTYTTEDFEELSNGTSYSLNYVTKQEKYNVSCSLDYSYPWCVFKEIKETTVDDVIVTEENVIFDIRSDDGICYFYTFPETPYLQNPEKIFKLAYHSAFSWHSSFFCGDKNELFQGYSFNSILLRAFSTQMVLVSGSGMDRGDISLSGAFYFHFTWDGKPASLLFYDLVYDDFLFKSYSLEYSITYHHLDNTYTIKKVRCDVNTTAYTPRT